MRAMMIAGALLAGSLGAPSTWADPEAPLSRDELQILAHLEHADREEIEVGRLAEQKSACPEVKRYAQMIVDDHTQSERDVVALARAHGQDVPDVEAFDETDRAHLQRDAETAMGLRALDGAAFDRAFLQAMMKGHDEALAELAARLETTSDPALAALLHATKPMLARHRRLATDLVTSPACPGP